MTDSTKPTDAASIATGWWRSLTAEQPGRRGVNRAALARLRRAKTPLEVMLVPDALRLIARLPCDPDRVAALAGVLAFVRETEDRKIAHAIGRASLDDDKALMSEGRFRRLLVVTRNDELMDAMRRLVRLTNGRVNVYDMSRTVLYWGDHVRKRWIFDYYGVSKNVHSGNAAGTPSVSYKT